MAWTSRDSGKVLRVFSFAGWKGHTVLVPCDAAVPWLVGVNGCAQGQAVFPGVQSSAEHVQGEGVLHSQSAAMQPHWLQESTFFIPAQEVTLHPISCMKEPGIED